MRITRVTSLDRFIAKIALLSFSPGFNRVTLTVDSEEFMRDVEFEVDLKPRTHLVTIEGRVYDRVRAVAKKRRVPVDRLVSRWIEEKLRDAA